jgi:RimJ/RimL family protein N-acetyltransferase
VTERPNSGVALPLGEPLDWSGAQPVRPVELRGSHVVLRPVEPAGDAASLYRASHPPEGDERIWTYLPYGPYASVEALEGQLLGAAASEDPLFFAIAPLPRERPLGIASYLRITPDEGAIEIGHIWFGTPLQRTAAATEAIFLLARHAFDDLGYRRLEWKCNALNAASRSAAERFGFTFEGVFRRHQVVKGRNRDTAWYSIVDEEWPAVRAAFEAWLAPGNFDPEGRQRGSLSELTAAALMSR